MLHFLYIVHVSTVSQLSTNSICSFSESEIKRYQFEPETDSESIDSSTFDHEQEKLFRVKVKGRSLQLRDEWCACGFCIPMPGQTERRKRYIFRVLVR